jgi:hypothetical protein
MISVSRAWAVSITVCIAVCCGVTTVANAALLRAVRVGEHKDFTRLAFEFDSPARYSQPVLKDKGTISVTFPESKAPFTLPRRTLKRNTRHFDTIGFDQQGSDLTAEVTVTYPHFEFKAFTLLKPHRVVVDVYWLDAPLQVKVAPPALENVKKPAPLAPEKAEPTLTKKTLPLPKPQKKEVSEEESAPTPTEKITLAPKPKTSDVPVAKATPEKIAKIPEKDEASVTQPEKASFTRPPETTPPDVVKSLPVAPQPSRVQVYSVAALIALNILIIIIFAVMMRSRLRRNAVSEYDENDELEDALMEQDFAVESIDKEIREKLRKYETL